MGQAVNLAPSVFLIICLMEQLKDLAWVLAIQNMGWWRGVLATLALASSERREILMVLIIEAIGECPERP